MKKKIRCVETGIEYESQKEANIQLGKNPNCVSINHALTGYSETAYGYHWEYVNKDEATHTVQKHKISVQGWYNQVYTY